MGWSPTAGLPSHTLMVAGAERRYWLAPAAAPAPLVVMLHGRGTTGRNMAAFTGLARRGPQRGVSVAFPDGHAKVWGADSRRAADDDAFLTQLVAELAAAGVSDGRPPVLAGLSNGAFFAERIARLGVLEISGLMLVAGTSLESTRARQPVPAAPAPVMCLIGTADPLVPYAGGLGRLPGPLGWVTRRGRRREPAVGAELVARDWAAANGVAGQPVLISRPAAAGDLDVTCLTWSADGRPPVVLYRIEGGGHGWPGGPQYLPPRLIGPVARGLDATGILLDAAAGPGLSRT
jgi:polyhydroxybutyrate depolymerase